MTFNMMMTFDRAHQPIYFSILLWSTSRYLTMETGDLNGWKIKYDNIYRYCNLWRKREVINLGSSNNNNISDMILSR